jgi:predicted secreted protein
VRDDRSQRVALIVDFRVAIFHVSSRRAIGEGVTRQVVSVGVDVTFYVRYTGRDGVRVDAETARTVTASIHHAICCVGLPSKLVERVCCAWSGRAIRADAE